MNTRGPTLPRQALFELPDATTGTAPASVTDPLVGVDLSKEVHTKTIRPTNDEQSFLSLARPCSAVDVYVDMRNVPVQSGSLFAVRIYALVGGMRICVGRGRINNQANGLVLDRWKWVASARVMAPSFEVTVSREPIAGGDVPASRPVEFPIAVAGYQASGDTPLAPPVRTTGVWSTGTSQLLTKGPGELLRANGTNAEAAAAAITFVQFWDTATVPGAGRLVEEIVSKGSDNWRADYGNFPLLFESGLLIAASTTTAAFVANVGATGVHIAEIR